MTDARGDVFSPREREFLRGEHDDKYYQYRANLRMRCRHKLESVLKDLELLLGNERLDYKGDEVDWTKLTEPVQAFLRTRD